MASSFTMHPSGQIWQSALQDASPPSRHDDSTLILVGTAGAGKRELVRRLAMGGSSSAPPQMAGLSSAASSSSSASSSAFRRPIAYHYFFSGDEDVDGEEDDDEKAARVDTWVLEDPHYKELMQCPLTPSLEVLERCTFAICVDISAPHAIVAELAQWSELLDEQANAVVQRLSVEDRDALKMRLRRHVARGYLYSGGDAEETQRGGGGDNEAETMEKLDRFDFPDGVFETNTGIPIVVVVTKADLIDSKAAENPLRRVSEDKLDAVQRYLRLWCLKRGAALVYTSAALDTNCDVLRRCITWRSPRSSSGNGQTAAAEVARRSSLYVPFGWDSKQLIDSTCGGDASPRPLGELFKATDATARGRGGSAPKADLIEVEDESAFLQRMLIRQRSNGASTFRSSSSSYASSVPSIGGGEAQTLRASSAPDRAASGASSRAAGGGGGRKSARRASSARILAMQGGADSGGSGADGEPDAEVLSNFFQGLIKGKDKSKSKRGTRSSSAKATKESRTAAERELSKMKRKVGK